MIFNNICKEIINSQFILNTLNIIYQTKNILKNPEDLFNIVFIKINDLYQKKQFNKKIKININQVLNSEYCRDFKDDGLYQQLINLFKDKNDAYFTIEINDFYDDITYGEFSPPNKFKEFIFNSEIYSFNLPKIQIIPTIDNILIKKKAQQFNLNVKIKQNYWKKKQLALEKFKQIIFKNDFNNFGEIHIYSNIFQNKENDLYKPTLKNIICHELQHLCIFLLSIAKTSIYFSMYFGNTINNVYNLKPQQFFTLAQSYNKIINKIYSDNKNNYSIQQFINILMEMIIHNQAKPNDFILDERSNTYLNVKRFFKDIYDDQKFHFNDIRDLITRQKKTISKQMKNKRFNILIKWLIRFLKQENN